MSLAPMPLVPVTQVPLKPAAVFAFDAAVRVWRPGPLARGPFAGLQGGAVAALMTHVAEQLAAKRGLGEAVAVSAWFLRPAPAAPLKVRADVLHAKGRLAVVDATLFEAGEDAPLATARVTFMAARDLSEAAAPAAQIPSIDPTTLPESRRRPPVEGPWMMDAMDVRRAPGGDWWFRMRNPIAEGAGALANALGPADWSHGLGRPIEGRFADPNPTLNVQLLRPPASGWVGVRPRATWRPEAGRGFGAAELIDEFGPIGAVSMAVALSPFRAAQPEPHPAPA